MKTNQYKRTINQQKQNKTSASKMLSQKQVKKKTLKEKSTILEDPEVKYSTTGKIRSVGNSKGVILSNEIMKASGIDTNSELFIQAKEGKIIIQARKAETLNTDLSTWDALFKEAIRKGDKPEGDLFEGIQNEFDETEW